jgi:hypothetical protein
MSFAQFLADTGGWTGVITQAVVGGGALALVYVLSVVGTRIILRRMLKGL